MRVPPIAVVTPTYNETDELRRAVRSVAKQQYPNLQHVVVDDGPYQPTPRSLVDTFGARLIRHARNRGHSAARNTGLEATDSPWVLFLDADDFLGAGTIQPLAEGVADDNTIVAGRWWALQRTVSGWRRRAGQTKPSGADGLSWWLDGNYYTPSALLWPRPLLNRIGGWDESITSDADGDIMLRALSDGGTLKPVEGGNACYRRDPFASTISWSMDASSARSRFRVTERMEQRIHGHREKIASRYLTVAKYAFPADFKLGLTCLRKSETLRDVSRPIQRWMTALYYRVRYSLVGRLSHRLALYFGFV